MSRAGVPDDVVIHVATCVALTKVCICIGLPSWSFIDLSTGDGNLLV